MEDCTNDPSSELNGGPKTYVHILAPEPVNVTLFGERVFADILKLRILRGGDYPRLSMWVRCNHKAPDNRS